MYAFNFINFNLLVCLFRQNVYCYFFLLILNKVKILLIEIEYFSSFKINLKIYEKYFKTISTRMGIGLN